jgi:hypothetical protein
MTKNVSKAGPAGAALLACSMFCWSGTGIASEPAPDAQVLGITEGIVSYCDRVDAPVAAKLREKVRQMTQGASEEALAKIRETDEYRQGFESVADVVGKATKPNEAQPCTEALAATEK